MAATDQFYRDQKKLNAIFAASSVAMFFSVVWMMYDDHNREYKKVQRVFRDVEESVSLADMLDALPRYEDLVDARENVADARRALEDHRASLDSTRRSLVARRDKADADFQDVKALFDSRSSYRDDNVKQLGLAKTEEARAAARKALEARDREIDELRDRMNAARKALDEAVDELDAQVNKPLRGYEDALVRAEDYLKEINGKFDLFAKLAAEKKWKFGDTFRDWPIIDGFSSATRIHQWFSEDLTLNYGGFKNVTRYDRCMSCHLAIDRPAFTRGRLQDVADVRKPDAALDELAKAFKAAEVRSALAEAQLDNLRDDLNGQIAEVRKSLKAKSQDFAGEAKALAAAVRKAEPLVEPRSWEPVKAAIARLESSASRQAKLWVVHDLMKERKGEKNIGFDPDDVPTELRQVKLTPGQIAQYAAHPRLELFVDANSPHPREKFGCTICHDGQGSSTSFGHAAHVPNDAEHQKRWESSGEGGHHWHMVHAGDWDLPMKPKRFVESTCLKCHHQVTDLVRHGVKEEAPKLLEGFSLVKENGCYGCHEIAGSKAGRAIGPDLRLEPTPALEWLPVADQLAAKADTLNPPGTLRKVGPSLRRLAEKTHGPSADPTPWLTSWIKDPRGFRPDTKMPHFYGQSTNTPEFLKKEYEERGSNGSVKDQSLYPDAEVYAIAYYLQTESAKALGGEDGTRRIVREELLRHVKLLRAAVESAHQLQDKKEPTVGEKIRLSESKRDIAKYKKEAEGLRRRYRDLSLLSRPMSRDAINSKGEQAQALLERAVEPGLGAAEAKTAFQDLDDAVKALQDTSTPLAVLAKKDKLVDSAGKLVPWSSVPEPKADKAAGKALFIEKGCLACHSHAGAVIERKDADDETVSDMSEANFGPELSRVALKLGGDKAAARAWLVQWILNPNVYHPRTRMPVTQLSIPDAASIADWLLTPDDGWKAQGVAKPASKTLVEMAETALAKSPAVGRQAAATALTDGLSKEHRDRLAPDSDEQLLVEGAGSGRIDDARLMRYLGKKAIGRQGCYACHDIPGFEAAKPIGTALNDWGKKDPDRLAFEDSKAFLKAHFTVAETRDDAKDAKRPSSTWESAQGKYPIYEKFYSEALAHHQRDGFLSLKLAEPRSYDYGRVRDWEDRLRMPQFKFARTHRRTLPDGSKEPINAAEATAREKKKKLAKGSVDSYIARRDREGKGDYDAQTQFEEARARESVMTFILGLVAEPIPAKFVNAPGPDRMAEVKGAQVLEKYNCAGCHEIRPGYYEFKIPDAKKRDDFLGDLGKPDASDHFFGNSTAWVGRPSPIAGQFAAYGVSADDFPPLKIDQNKGAIYQLRLTEAFPFKDAKGAARNQFAGEMLDIPAEFTTGAHPTLGGDFTRLVGPQLARRDPTNFNTRDNQRSALPPPLIREGERVQPQWLFRFLLDPQMIRPWTVLRMPRFNMSDEEARALVEYFASVDKLNNPGLSLNTAFADIPQKEWSFWQRKNAEYKASLQSSAKGREHLEAQGKELPRVWERFLKDRVVDRERDIAGAEAALKDVKAGEEPKIRELLKAAQDDLKTLKDELAKAEKNDTTTPYKKFAEEWADDQVYATDAYKLLSDAKSQCLECHSVGSRRVSPEKGPNLDLTGERLRPEWTYQWIASPKRFLTYQSMMTQNFPKDTTPNPHYLFAPSRAYAEASRDALFNLPALGNLPANRYRLAPKGGK